MDQHAEIRDFLATRRARLTPEEAGVPTFGGTRRVPGLRREEVALLAGVSVDYYTRLERGRATGISPEVLDSVSRALRLDDVEREHLADLVRTSRPISPRTPKRRTSDQVRPGVQAVLDAMSMPAYVLNPRIEVVAANALGRAVYSLGDASIGIPFSIPRFAFLDPRGADFYRDWDVAARNQVALLRSATGRFPADDELITLIGELSTHSAPFRTLWAAHDVLKHREGQKRYHHPSVGDVEFMGESFALSHDEDLSLVAYTFAPNSPTEQAMRLLSSWTATTHRIHPA